MTEKSDSLNIYLVGGAVRDELLGIHVVERDWVVVGHSAEQLLNLGFKQVGRDFPVFLHPQTKEEYALARVERKQAPGHTGFKVLTALHITLEEDLARRDLTINAIARNRNGELIDPFNGHQDINNRVLRHVSPAFAEDPLRVLRVARFKAQLCRFNFTIAEATMALLKTVVKSGELETLSPDRIWKETERALLTDKPSLYFECLRQCGALKILFPEVDALFGVPQRRDYHPEIDSGIHTMMVVDRAAELTPELSVRFAALIHDLGKALTPPSRWPRHVGHEKRGLIPLKALTRRYPIPNKVNNMAQLCCEHHLLMHRFEELRAETILKLIEKLNGFTHPEKVKQFALLCKADSQGRGGDFANRPYDQFDALQKAMQAAKRISAADVHPAATGKQIGAEIRRLRVNQITLLKHKSFA